MRSINTPPTKGTNRPGSVTTMTGMLTAMVECVADRMYQLTAVKFKPLPNRETNIATEKNRKPRCAQMARQSTRVVVVAVGIEPAILLLGEAWGSGAVQSCFGMVRRSLVCWDFFDDSDRDWRG